MQTTGNTGSFVKKDVYARAAQPAVGKLAKKAAKKALPAVMLYQGAKEVVAGVKAKSASRVAAGAASMTFVGTAAAEAANAASRLRKVTRQDRVINGDRGVNPKEPVNSYNKRKKREAVVRSQSRKRG